MILSFDPDQPRPGVFTFAARGEAYWYSFTEASALQSGQQSRAYCDRSRITGFRRSEAGRVGHVAQGLPRRSSGHLHSSQHDS